MTIIGSVLGSCIVAVFALGGVIWASRRADARERERHRREQLVAAIGELLGVAEELIRQVVFLNDAVLDYEARTGESAMGTGRIAAEVEPLFNAFTALTIRGSSVRFRIDLLEPRLTDAAGGVLARCIKMGEAAVHNRGGTVIELRDGQLRDMRGLIDRYRKLA